MSIHTSAPDSSFFFVILFVLSFATECKCYQNCQIQNMHTVWNSSVNLYNLFKFGFSKLKFE